MSIASVFAFDRLAPRPAPLWLEFISARPSLRGAQPLPPEIAFLADHGVAPGILLAAASIALRAGVTADAALLGEGLMPEEEFYRCIARHLGVPFLEQPLQVKLLARAAIVEAAGVATLAPNRFGLRHVIAPRGAALRTLMTLRRGQGGARASFVVATPKQFGALVRLAGSEEIAEEASAGLCRRDRTLSAAAGMTNGQLISAMGASFALGAGTALDVFWTLNIASMICGFLFAAAIGARLAAIMASIRLPAAEGLLRAPEDALPTYTIVAPLYREAVVVRKIVAALDALDYPVLGSKLT